MFRLSLKAVFITCVAASLSFAQNARIDAMGGVSVIDDIGAVTTAPADMNDFKDQVQASNSGESFGPYIGIKSLGDMFSLGVLGNNGLVLDEFYQSGIETVNDALEDGAGLAPQLDSDMPPIPHLLFGLDFDALTLGLDLFIEMNRSSYSRDADGDETTEKGRVSNVGGILNANISLGDDMLLSPVVGFGRPSISQISEEPDTTSSEWTSENGLFFTLGTEFGMRLLDASWFVGVFWSLEKFRFADEITNTEETINTNNTVNGYLGFTTNVLNNLLFAGEYSLTLDYNTDKPSDDISSTLTNVTHRWAAGLEKPVEGFWIFDQLIGRAGAFLEYSDDKVSSTNDDLEVETNSSGQGDYTQVTPTVGLGLKKGLFQFDIVSSLTGWTGLVAGPPVVKGTLTLNFGGGSSESVYEPTPSYTPTPSQEPTQEEPEEEEEPDEEDDGGTDFSF
ncbi:MAG: hypothetical protein ACOC4C_00330 [Fibrobacterota bacterium]